MINARRPLEESFWRVVARVLASRGRIAPALLPLMDLAPMAHSHVYDACRVYLNRSDGVANDNPATNGEWRLLGRLLPDCDVAFDVGANCGDWVAAALQANPNLLVHCFEPSAVTFRALLDRSFPPSIRCNNIGLSSALGRATLHTYASDSGLNSLYRRQGLEDGWGLSAPNAQEQVDLTTLSHYCAAAAVDRIDFLKLDVEGHELAVLEGGRRLFVEGRIKYGQFEYGGCNIDARVLLADLFAWFTAVGYRLFKIYPDRLQPVDRYAQQFENFQYQNWVFARRDLPIPT